MPPSFPSRAAAVALAVLLLAVTGVARSEAGTTTADARIAGSAPSTWDPQLASSAETAATLAQVFEGLTAFDGQSRVQPALADRWDLAVDGKSLTFHLRPGIVYSDGSPIEAQDVVDSWLALLDPERHAALASLLDDVVGATAYRRGLGPRDNVRITAGEGTVSVQFRRPAAYFTAVAASPSLAVVPPSMLGRIAAPALPSDFVGSGAYLPTSMSEIAIELEANERYWAGPPPLDHIQLLTDYEGQSPVAVYQAGGVDYTDIFSMDASWIRYDPTLGPELREIQSFSVTYYGFDTTEPPFDDARVRRAFAGAVDWDRLVALGSPDATPATSLVPVGIPGRAEEDFSPAYDPDAARTTLADAGYPRGANFPEVTLVTFGLGYDEAIATELREELGVTVNVEQMDFSDYFELLDTDPPQLWALSWIADYPHPQDFLGLLLETGSTNNYGGWSDTEFDAAIAAAGETTDLEDQGARYAEAERIVQAQAPIVPVEYVTGWALGRTGLAGAIESGVGFLRFASLAWSR